MAIGALVVLSALARLATAWLLLKIRHRGPGLWWSALCVAFAFGAVYHPIYSIMMGGIAGTAYPAPFTWSQLLFAIELLVLFRAFSQGRAAGLWFLIPTFVLWANIDESFLTGLIVLAAAVAGRVLDGRNATWLVANSEKPLTTEATSDGQDVVDRQPVRLRTADHRAWLVRWPPAWRIRTLIAPTSPRSILTSSCSSLRTASRRSTSSRSSGKELRSRSLIFRSWE